MTKALALIFYENLLTGNQLLNRLNDLDYRTLVTGDLGRLHEQAVSEKPIVIIAELGALCERVCGVFRGLRSTPETQHIPIVGFTSQKQPKEAAHAAAQGQAAGATLVVGEGALVTHLGQVLDQALRVD